MNKNIVSLRSQRLKSLCRIWLDILQLSSEMHFMNKHGVCVFCAKSLYMYGRFSNWEVSLEKHCICTVSSVIGKYHLKSTV